MAGNKNILQGYQEATNQLLAINQQRRGNINEAKNQELLEMAQNNTLAQAAQFVNTKQPNVTDANLNPATQNILGQYGLGQPKIQKTSSSSQEVTKQNIVINNKNTTITNNNVSVPTGGGPIQGRPVQFQNQDQIKFKSWVANTFAQQNEATAKRQREYEKRDSELRRNSNKLLKKLEETGKSIATFPTKMASSVGNQLKTLLLVLGFGYIAKHWPILMEKLDNIEEKVVNFFSENGGLAHMFGGKDGEGPVKALKKLFFDKNSGVLALIKKWLGDRMEERSAAVRNVPKPELSLKHPGESLGKIINYLGDILGAILDPSKAAGRTVTTIAKEQSKEYRDKNGTELGKKDSFMVWDPYQDGGKAVAKKASRGDMAIMDGSYSGIKPGSVDSSGNLVNSSIASISQGKEIDRAIQESKETGKLQTSSVAVGFSRLKDSAERNGNVILSEDFLLKYLGEDEMKRLGLTKPTPHVYVVRNKTPEEIAFDLAAISKDNEKTQSLLKQAGAGLGLFGGMAAGGALGEIKELFEKKGIPDTVVELRRGSNAGTAGVNEKAGEYILQDSRFPVPNVYEVTPTVLQEIIDKVTGTKNTEVNINSADFTKAIEKYLITNENKSILQKDLNIDQVYSPNKLMEQHKQEERKMWNESRLKSGANYTIDKIKETGQNIKNRITGNKNTDDDDNTSFSTSGRSWKKSTGGKVIVKGKETDQTFDVDSAVRWIDSNTDKVLQVTTSGKIKGFTKVGQKKPSTASNGLCAGHVRRAIESGGISTKGRPGHASLYYTNGFLPSIGFDEISIDSMNDLQPGDIYIEESKPGTKNTIGHAAMWDGKQWVSDFKQKGMKVHGSNTGTIHIYRHPNATSSLWNSGSASSILAQDSQDNSSSANPEPDLADNNVLPEFTITADSNTGNTVNASFTPESSIATDHTAAFSENNSTGSSAFNVNKPEAVDYTASIASLEKDVNTMMNLLGIMGNTDAQSLEKLNDISSKIGMLKNSSKESVKFPTVSYTDTHYNAQT